MDEIEEKRVFGDQAGAAQLLVAAGIGVLSVSVAADRVGRFGVIRRCDPTDVATDEGRVAVSTAEDVLVRGRGAEGFAPTGFGPAVAIGFDDGAIIAAGTDGRVARWDPDGDDEMAVDERAGWSALGALDADVRAIDGRLVAAADGVHRLPGLDYAGLDDVSDVAAAGPLAATADGLYSLGNGWMAEVEGAFRAVEAESDRAHAAGTEGLSERSVGGWRAVDLPVDDPVVDVAYGPVVYAVTASGDVLAEGEDGWRIHPLGVDGVVGCAFASGPTSGEGRD